MLNRSGKSGKFSRVSDLRGKAIKYNASFRFFVQIIFQFMFPFIPSVLRFCDKCFISDTWIVSNAFSVPIEIFIWLLLFSLLE